MALLFRPEHCRLVTNGATAGPNRIACQVERSVFLGSQTEHLVRAATVQFVLRTLADDTPGPNVTVLVDPDHAWAFPRT